MVNSRAKGKRGELEAAEWLRDNLGCDARRGCQFKGGPDSPDIAGVNGLHLEVKRVQALNVYGAVEQAKSECPGGSSPCVMWRRDKKEWLFVVPGDQLVRFCRRIVEHADAAD